MVLFPSQCFDEFEERVSEDPELRYANIRVDLEPSRGRLIVGMPGDLHECFLAWVSKEILGLLSSIVLSAQTPPALAHLMREVIPKGSPNRQLGDYRHAPDLSFGHRKVLMPGLVVEFAHSQKSRHLRHLAYDYIVRSKGKIQAVLGLDLEYGGGGKAATISLWRVKWETHADGRPLVKCDQELTAQPFRDTSGLPVEGSMTLYPTDFLPRRISEGLPNLDHPLVLTYSVLNDMLSTAEEQYKLAIQPSSDTDVAEQSPDYSSPDEMLSGDEQRWWARENWDERQAEKADSSYDGNGV